MKKTMPDRPDPTPPNGELPMAHPAHPCCGPPTGCRSAAPDDLAGRSSQSFVIGTVDTDAGPVPIVSTRLTGRDRLGTVKARWGVGRMSYRVVPGLYAVGHPGAGSPVLVTASYKLTFDALRSALPGLSAWILVLDTDGINVWCAAGKGTFGTDELVRRVRGSRLENVVDHRTLILPQLSAPGVAAHEVRQQSGYRVVYGPIRAGDIPRFLEAGKRAGPEMRFKRFPLSERLALIPVELVAALKYGLVAAAILLVSNGLGWPGSWMDATLVHGVQAAAAVGLAIVAGAVLTPLLLPWLPGRAFALKGTWAGCAGAVALAALFWPASYTTAAWLSLSGLGLLLIAAASFLGMNFTGASTYTSLSGVRREMRLAVPLQIAAGVVGLALAVSARFVA